MDIATTPRACSVCNEPLSGDERGHHRCQGAPKRRSVAPQALPVLLTVNQVAEALSLSRSKVYDLIASRDLDAYRPGGRLRVPAEAVAKLLERCKV